MAKEREGPDQARSWAIALAGCTINALMSGISRTTGLFYVSLIEIYGVSRFQANLPFTLRNVLRNLAGPLAGAIGQKYGARGVTVIGGVFGAAGIGLCTFAPNVIWICILWGGVHGLGVALGNTLFQVIVNQYFLKHRATASGIALSGACVGSFVLPVILEYTLQNFGLQGTFLITGGMMMHVLPAAIMMQEPPWIARQRKEMRRMEKINKDRPTVAKGNVALRKNKMPTVKEEIGEEVHEKNNIIVTGIKKIHSFDVIDSSKSKNINDLGKDEKSTKKGFENAAFVESQTDLTDSSSKELQDVDLGKRLRTISIGDGSLSLPPSPVDCQQETSLSKGLKKLFSDPMFHMISINMVGFAMIFDPAITVIVDYVTDKGLEEDSAKYFIFMMSLGDLIGRLCFGWVTDRNYLSVAKFMLLVQVIQGICFILLPLFYDFDILLALIVIYGLASGAALVMFPILLSKYLASVQSLAIGFMTIFTGFTSFTIPPLIGYFRDNIGSYDGMFILSGSLCIFIGCLWVFEPLLLKLKIKRRSASLVITS